MARAREDRNEHQANARAWQAAVKAHPSLPAPDAQITREHSDAIRAGFETALTMFIAGKIPAPEDAELQKYLRSRIDAVLGDELNPPTNAEVKARLLFTKRGSLEPENIKDASEELKSKDYRAMTSVGFMVTLDGALKAYAEQIEGKLGQTR